MHDDPPTWRAALKDTVVMAAENADRVDREVAFPIDTVDRMRSNQLLTAMLPRIEGGLGCGVEDFVTIARALGEVCSSTALIWLMHSQQLMTLSRFASASARNEFRERNARSALYVASVTTEASTGGSIRQAEASLSAVEQGFRLDRRAPIVTGGEVADAFLIKAGLSGHGESVRPVMILAYREELELTTRKHLTMMGMRGVGNVSLDLRGHLPQYRLLEEGERQYRAITTSFAALAHLGWSAAWVGCAESAWRRTLSHLRRRSGKAITSEALRLEMSEVRLRLETASSMLRLCTVEVARLGPFAEGLERSHVQLHLNALKIVAARSCSEAVERMINTVGVEGYLADSPLRLERSLRDIRSASLIYNDRRLHLAIGSLSVLDPNVKTLGHDG